MFDLVERPGAFNIGEAVIHNHADVTGVGPIVITTPPQRWAYAASFVLKDDPQDPLANHPRLLIRVDATIEQGEIGMAAANAETGDALSKEDRKAGPGRTLFEVHPSFVTNTSQEPAEADQTQAEHFGDLFSVSEIWVDVGAHLGQETFP